MNPVGANLTAGINAVIRHAVNEIFKQAEMIAALVQPMAVFRQVKHPAMNPDRAW